jgi:hypothetical protein
MSKINLDNNFAVGMLCAYRDEKRILAKQILESATAVLESAKEQYHQAKIQSNRLLKDAEKIQNAITPSMQQEYDETQKVLQDYTYKTNSDIISEEWNIKQ